MARRFLGVRGVKVPLADRFWDKVDLSDGPDGCCNWMAAIRDGGYGVIRADGPRGVTRLVRAHVAAWLLTGRRIPPGLLLRHKCDNPRCCNVNHLEPGTHADNTRDKMERGRFNHCRRFKVGEFHHSAVLSDDDVLAIRSASGGRGLGVVLAAQFHVSRTTISAIRRGLSRSRLAGEVRG